MRNHNSVHSVPLVLKQHAAQRCGFHNLVRVDLVGAQIGDVEDAALHRRWHGRMWVSVVLSVWLRATTTQYREVGKKIESLFRRIKHVNKRACVCVCVCTRVYVCLCACVWICTVAASALVSAALYWR